MSPDQDIKNGLHHVPSDTEKRRKTVKAKIQDIYDASRQNYGAPKITVELRKTGEVISERTVGTYIRQMRIRAQWSKPWTITCIRTIDDFICLTSIMDL